MARGSPVAAIQGNKSWHPHVGRWAGWEQQDVLSQDERVEVISTDLLLLAVPSPCSFSLARMILQRMIISKIIVEAFTSKIFLSYSCMQFLQWFYLVNYCLALCSVFLYSVPLTIQKVYHRSILTWVETPRFLYFHLLNGSWSSYLNSLSLNFVKMWSSPTSFTEAENVLTGNLA